MWDKKEKKETPNQEEKLILRAAIDKAEKNGYKGHLRYLPISIMPTGNKKIDDKKLDELANDAFYFHGRAIVFDTGFQKTFFPKGEIDKKRNVIKDWKYHNAEMYKTNPIRYVESYL